jgi:hypothetical protein
VCGWFCCSLLTGISWTGLQLTVACVCVVLYCDTDSDQLDRAAVDSIVCVCVCVVLYCDTDSDQLDRAAVDSIVCVCVCVVLYCDTDSDQLDRAAVNSIVCVCVWYCTVILTVISWTELQLTVSCVYDLYGRSSC